MNGHMVFAQFYIQEMMRVFRQLEHVELGLLMRISLENCVYQAPLKCDNASLLKRLGCKTKKTYERQLATLIEAGAVRESDGSIIAEIAAGAIEHFQVNSKNAKSAVANRKDRKKPAAELDDPFQVALSEQIHGTGLPATQTDCEPCAFEDNDGSRTIPFDNLLKLLHAEATRIGHQCLAETLNREVSKRHVEGWYALGLPVERIVAKAREVMNNKGDERISSWKYFDAAMQNMARER